MPIDLGEAITADVLDLIRDCVILRDLDGRVLYWNRAAAKLYGWSNEQAVGQVADTLLNTRHDESPDTPERHVLAAGRWNGRLKRTAATGAELVIDARWTLRRDAAGKPLAVFETGHDVTAHTRVGLSAGERERRYRNLFDSPAAAFFELDFSQVVAMVRELRASGTADLARHLSENPSIAREMMRRVRVVEVNDHAVERFGRGDKRELFVPTDAFWPERSTGVFAESVVAAVSGQTNFVRETVLRTLQGVEFDAELAVHFDPENTHSGMVTLGVLDLTERNRARAAFEHAEFMYRNLFHGMAVPFLRLDSTGVRNLFMRLHDAGVTDLNEYMKAHPEVLQSAMDASIVVEANAAAVQLYRVDSPNDLYGPVTRLFAPSRGHVLGKSFAAGYAGEAGFQAEAKVRRFDGSGEVDVLLFVIATPEMRARGIVLAGSIDISEQVAARNALDRMRADLAHSARVSMLGELTASIAHEVNQPLTAITTNTEAGLRWLGRANPDIGEARTLMTRVVADARRAADVIQRIRNMAANKQAAPALIGINHVVEETAAFLQHELQVQRVSLSLELAQDLPQVNADRVQLQQVLVNLAVNAMQAMGGAASERRDLRIVTELVEPRFVRVRVEDSGPGIAAENLPRLFESFYSTKSNGMGMGLPISQSIVEAHGGRIEAANKERGACFAFTLPAAEGAS